MAIAKYMLHYKGSIQQKKLGCHECNLAEPQVQIGNYLISYYDSTFPNQTWWLGSNPMGSFEEMHIIADGFFPSHTAMCGVGVHCG